MIILNKAKSSQLVTSLVGITSLFLAKKDLWSGHAPAGNSDLGEYINKRKIFLKLKYVWLKEAYYKEKKKKKKRKEIKYFRQCQSKCYPDILRCIFHLICIVLLICLLNFICVLNFPQIDNYRLHLGFPIKANPMCVCVCVFIFVFQICMSGITAALLLFWFYRKKQTDPVALVLIHLLHSRLCLFSPSPVQWLSLLTQQSELLHGISKVAYFRENIKHTSPSQIFCR